MPDKTIEQILDALSSRIRSLVELAMRAIDDAAPELEVYGRENEGNIAYRGNQVVIVIAPHSKHVNLHFYQGVRLEDPAGLLQGSGKALRHVKLTKESDLNREAFADLLRQAVALDKAS